MLLPGYEKKILLIQLAAVFFFSCSLYFFLAGNQQKKILNHELAAVRAQRQELSGVRRNMEAYNKLVRENDVLKTIRGAPIWEQVEFKWTALDFAELLARLESLARQENLFVMKSFKTDFDKPTDVADVRDKPVKRERVYHIQGYILCPYQ